MILDHLHAFAEAQLPEGFTLRLRQSESLFELHATVCGPILTHSTALTDAEMSEARFGDVLNLALQRSVETIRADVAEKFGTQPAIDATVRNAVRLEMYNAIHFLRMNGNDVAALEARAMHRMKS